MIYIGSDHRGFEYKEALKSWLKDANLEFEDIGAFELNIDDDYVDFAEKVARATALDPEHRGILLCNNGVGVDITANKIKDVRSVLGWNVEQIRLARNDDNVNILSLPAGFLPFEEILHFIEVFLGTPYSAEQRFERRLEKIKIIENG